MLACGVRALLLRKQVLDWFEAKGLSAYSISCGPALLYNNLFPRCVRMFVCG
jgi:hypothetical protein